MLQAERDTSTVPTNREREASHVKSVIPVSVFENYVLLKKADPKNVFDEYKVGNLPLDSVVAPVTADMQLQSICKVPSVTTNEAIIY